MPNNGKPTHEVRSKSGQTSQLHQEAKTNSVHIMHFNVQGVTDKVPLFEVLLHELQQPIDIMCITEHWLKNSEAELLSISKLKCMSHFTREAKKRGGSCIMVNEKYTVQNYDELIQHAIETEFECSAIKIEELGLTILCIYRPPTGNIDIFFEQLESCLLVANRKMCGKVVICGDFNIDILKPSKNVSTLQQILLTYNFNILIDEPTRISNNTATCIDNFFINFEHRRVGVFNSPLSDHTYQILSIASLKGPKNEMQYLSRDFSPENIGEFCALLQGQDWNELQLHEDPNDAYDTFSKIFRHYFEIAFPLKKKVLKSRSVNKWITADIVELSQEKTKLWTKIKTNKRENMQNVQLEQQYRRLSNGLKTLVRDAKRKYFSDRICTSQNKTKESWKIVNSMNNPTATKKMDIMTILDPGGNLITNTLDIANTFNEYFLRIATTLNLQEPCFDIEMSRINETVFLHPCDEVEIVQIIRRLKNSKTCGWDDIPSILIKETALIIAKPVAHIVNMSLSMGIFPDALKKAVVIPIYKKQDRQELTNYRPISILPILSKVFEKIIYTRLISFFGRYRVISEDQHGFMRKKTIDQALFKTLNQIYDALNRNEFLAVFFLDLSKAFDSMDIELLLCKIHNYGVRGVALDLIRSYLTGRQQCVKIRSTEEGAVKDVISQFGPVCRGVPQGSVLGPLLFILYINDLPTKIRTKLILFADDTTVIFREPTRDSMTQKINDIFKNLMVWFNENTLKMNVDKTQLLCFKNDIRRININHMDTIVEASEKVKFLGLYLDHKLNFKAHIEHLANKTSRLGYLLYKLRDALTLDVLMQVYYGHIQSNVRYGILFWGGSTDVDRILKVQKRCLRIMTYAKPTDSAKPIFIRLGVLTVIDIFILESAMFVKKNPNLFENFYFDHAYETRNRNHLRVMQTTKAYIDSGVLNNCIRIYNTVPKEIKDSNPGIFKSKLKNLLISKAHYNLKEFIL